VDFMVGIFWFGTNIAFNRQLSRSRQKALCGGTMSAHRVTARHLFPNGSKTIPRQFSLGVDTTRSLGLMFRDLAMVFGQAPIVLPATECAPHCHVVSSEYDEIARFNAKLGFQVAACRPAREL
jgi:hypothetical protein